MKRSTPLRRRAPLARTGWGTRGQRKPLKPKPAPHIAAGFTLAAKGEDRCRVCGHPASELHHAVPRSRSRAGRDDLRNGLPLCGPCHNAHHAGQPICRSVFTAAEWAFISTLMGPGWLARRYPRDLAERELREAA